MMKIVIIFILTISVLLPNARAQILPPPVDLGIPNLRQETQVWCWVAAAQQIIHGIRGPTGTPPQCALVAMANGWHPAVCCNQPNPICLRTGQFFQIAQLIQQFSGRMSNYAPPADPMTLYGTLASGHAIILQIATGIPANTHVVVLRGMSFISTPFGAEPILHINDPMSIHTQSVPFSQLLRWWIDALVIN